jgi:hypothetical protein
MPKFNLAYCLDMAGLGVVFDFHGRGVTFWLGPLAFVFHLPVKGEEQTP